MDFQDSPEEAGYRATVCAWLAANAPTYELPADSKLSDDDLLHRAKGWQAAKAAAGYVGIVWPKAAGGQGGTPIQNVIFHQEEEHYRVPTMPFTIGVGMCLPTVFTHGSPEVASRYVPPAMRGEEIWCQLFSEPSAGSDLAAARTRAVREGEDWVVNGQKVWTSYAHKSDFGLLLARTDPSVPKHKGLTMFYVDMRSPGIEVRPIRSMYGDAEFNEVFFDNVRIPDAQRLGEIGDGWKVSLTTLMFERLAIGGRPAGAPSFGDFLDLLDENQIDPREHAEMISRFYLADEGIALTRMRLMTALSRGGVPGPEASINKLVLAKNLQDMCAYGQELMGASFLDFSEASPMHQFNFWQTYAAGVRIAGGTDEILRNIIAERVLGLPADIRLDRDLPFNQLS